MSASLESLPSHELLARTHVLVRRGNAVEAELLAHLGEVDARRLYLERAFPSMFVFCTRVLHFSEPVAYKRIAVARAARRHPEILGALRQGALNLTALGLLAPRLSEANCAELIRAASHKSSDEIRRLLADRAPRPDVPASMRRIPGTPAPDRAPVGERAAPGDPRGVDAASPAEFPPAARSESVRREPVRSGPLRSEPGGSSPDAPTRSAAPEETWRQRGRSEPLGGERYCVRFTAGAALHAQLRELQALMRHQIPDGDLGKILARAVPLLLGRVRKRKFGECSAPRSKKTGGEQGARSIPAATRRSVTRRDGEGCTYVSPEGRRCGSRDFLEFHHREPWAHTRAHPPEGITLFCRAHNQHQARRDFGEAHMDQFRPRAADLDRFLPEGRRTSAKRVPSSSLEPGAGSDHLPQLDSNPVRRAQADGPPRPGRETRPGR